MDPLTEFKCEDVEVKVKIETQDIDTGDDEDRSLENINFVKCEIVDADCLENIKLENNIISAPNIGNIENIDHNTTNANAGSSERYLEDARENKGNMFYYSQCGKKFTQNDHLIKDQIVHNGEKPYQCSECGKCFTIKNRLVQHRNTSMKCIKIMEDWPGMPLPISAKEQCLGCNFDINNILMHLSKKPGCKAFYDIDFLKRQANERKLEKNRARQATYLQRQKEKDLEGFKANKAASDKKFKNKRRISAMEQCLGCKNYISNILMHLSKKPDCKTFYDIDLLKRQANERKLEKKEHIRLNMFSFRKRKILKDLSQIKMHLIRMLIIKVLYLLWSNV